MPPISLRNPIVPVIATGAAIAVAAIVWLTTDGGAAPLDGRLLSDAPGILAEGAALYGAHCAACHGAALEGEPDWRTRGPDGLLPAPPHDETGHTWHHADSDLFILTKHGVQAFAGADYRSAMPAYDGVLSDREIVAVLSYIRSTWPADATAYQDRITLQRMEETRR